MVTMGQTQLDFSLVTICMTSIRIERNRNQSVEKQKRP